MKRNVFDLDYPIIQAPMAGNILSPEFIANVCNNGMLGFIASGYLSLEQLEEQIIRVKQNLINDKAKFGVNLFLDAERIRAQKYSKPIEFIGFEHSIGLNIDDNEFIVPQSISKDDYVELLIKHNVPIVSCTFGFLEACSANKLKNHGIKIVGNATSIEEYRYCYHNGADAVVLQGAEAGGHQASFLSNEINQLSAVELLKQIRELDLDIAIIAAGGVSCLNFRDYLECSADYVQLGTAFMMTSESNVNETCKEFIRNISQTKLTKDITGKWARGTENKLIELMSAMSYFEFPTQHYMTAKLREFAKTQNLPEYMSLWASVNVDNYSLISLNELINKLKS
jgi:nitronate monooxygenase